MMGSSLALGLIKSGVAAKSQVMVADPSAACLEALADKVGKTTTDNKELVTACDVVVLAVKVRIRRRGARGSPSPLTRPAPRSPST